MDTLIDKPANARYSAHNSLRPVNFYCAAPHAQTVQLVGDFNNWAPLPLEYRADGWWYVQILLCHGHHQYRFLMDGKPMLDPAATGVGRDERGEKVSLLAVS